MKLETIKETLVDSVTDHGHYHDHFRISCIAGFNVGHDAQSYAVKDRLALVMQCVQVSGQFALDITASIRSAAPNTAGN